MKDAVINFIARIAAHFEKGEDYSLLYDSIMQAKADVEAGNFYTHEEIAKEFGVKDSQA